MIGGFGTECKVDYSTASVIYNSSLALRLHPLVASEFPVVCQETSQYHKRVFTTRSSFVQVKIDYLCGH